MTEDNKQVVDNVASAIKILPESGDNTFFLLSKYTFYEFVLEVMNMFGNEAKVQIDYTLISDTPLEDKEIYSETFLNNRVYKFECYRDENDIKPTFKAYLSKE